MCCKVVADAGVGARVCRDLQHNTATRNMMRPAKPLRPLHRQGDAYAPQARHHVRAEGGQTADGGGSVSASCLRAVAFRQSVSASKVCSLQPVTGQRAARGHRSERASWGLLSGCLPKVAAEHLLCQGVPVFPGVHGSYAAPSPSEAQSAKCLCPEVSVQAQLQKSDRDAC